MMRNGFSSLISFSLIFFMMIAFHVPFTWNILYCIPILILLVIGTFALSSILLHFGTFVSDLANAIPIILRIMFYMTGVFYSVATRVPAPYGPMLLYYNPTAFIINEMRNVLLFGVPLNLKWYFIWLGISLVVSVIGVAIIYKYEDKYAKVI